MLAIGGFIRGEAFVRQLKLLTRKLDPYHLRVAEEGIYLLARCHPNGEVKLPTIYVTLVGIGRPSDFTYHVPAGAIGADLG